MTQASVDAVLTISGSDAIATKPVSLASTRRIPRLHTLLADGNVVVELDDSAREWLSDKGYDPAYGARPLKRVIQRELQDPLVEKILSGDVKDGDLVQVSGGKFDNGADRLIFIVTHDGDELGSEDNGELAA